MNGTPKVGWFSTLLHSTFQRLSSWISPFFQKPKPVPELPVEVLSHLFTFISIDNEMQLRRVNKDWLNAWEDEKHRQINLLWRGQDIQIDALWQRQSEEINLLLENEEKVLKKT